MNSPKSSSTACDLAPVDEHVAVGEVPAARADQQRRGLLGQPVLAPVGLGVLDRPLDRVDEVDVALDDVAPGRRAGVLEVGHPAAGTGIKGVDGHLALGRAGDLDPAVLEVVRDRCDAPVALAHGPRLGQEVQALAGGQPGHALAAALQARSPLGL